MREASPLQGGGGFMGRPSGNTDRLLIEAGKALIPKTGFKGLKIRDVAKKAGVNLGMFNYHFRTKEKFIELLLIEVYGEFLSTLTMGSCEGRNCKERLKNALFHLGVFIRDHRQLILPLFEEIISGNKDIMEFAKGHMSKHFFILFEMMNECKKEGYIAKDIPTPVALISMVVPIAAPNLIAKVFEKYYAKTLFGIFTIPVQRMFLSDESLKQRIDIGLKGLAAEA